MYSDNEVGILFGLLNERAGELHLMKEDSVDGVGYG